MKSLENQFDMIQFQLNENFIDTNNQQNIQSVKGQSNNKKTSRADLSLVHIESTLQHFINKNSKLTEQFQFEKNKINAELEQCRKELEKYKVLNNKNLTDLNKSNTQLKDLIQENQTTKFKIEDYKNQVTNLQTNIDRLNQIKIELTNLNGLQSIEISKLNSEIKELKQKIININKQLEVQLNEYNHSKEEIEIKLTKSKLLAIQQIEEKYKVILNKHIVQSNLEFQKFYDESVNLQKKLKFEFNEQYLTLQQKNDELQIKLSQSKNEIETLRLSNEKQIDMALQSVKSELQNELNIKTAELLHLQTLHKSEIEILKNQMKNENTEQITQLQGKTNSIIEFQKNEIQRLQFELQKYSADSTHFVKSIELLSDKKEAEARFQLSLQIQSLEKEKLNIQVQAEKNEFIYKQKISEYENKLNSQNTNAETLQKNLANLRNQYSLETIKMQNIIRKLEEDIFQLRTQLDTKNQLVIENTEIINKLKKENDSLSQLEFEHLQLRVQSNQLKEKLDKLNEETNSLKDENYNLNIRLNQTNTDLQNLLISHKNELQEQEKILNSGFEIQIQQLKVCQQKELSQANDLYQKQLLDSKDQFEKQLLDKDQASITLFKKVDSYFNFLNKEKEKIHQLALQLSQEVRFATTVLPLKDYLHVTEKELEKVEIELRKSKGNTESHRQLEVMVESLVLQRNQLKELIENTTNKILSYHKKIDDLKNLCEVKTPTLAI